MRFRQLMFLSVALLIGCASVEPVPVKDFSSPKGIPYYGGEYYLIIYPDGKGNLAWTLEYAFDPTQKMEFRTTNHFANTSATLSFNNGLLTGAVTTADSSAVISTIIDAVSSVATALANQPDRAVGPPRVYRIETVTGGVEFYGENNDTPLIFAPVTTAPEE